MGLGVIKAALRLHKALALLDITATVERTYLIIGIELTVIGIHNSLAINNLDNIRKDRSYTRVMVVLGTLTIDISGILVNKHVTKALEALVCITHSTIGKDDSTVVVRSEVTHKDNYRRVALLDKI